MITFNLIFETNQDGFTPSQAQQDAMNLAASNWGSLFGNIATVDLLIESSSDSTSDTLMSAGSNFAEQPNPGFGNVAVVRNKILTGNDLNGAVGAEGSDNGYDGSVEINWGINWELDINETPNLAEDEFDFYSTFYHEIAHTLGFNSNILRLSNTDPDVYVDIFDEGDETPGSWAKFDEFLTDSNGAKVIDLKTNQIDSETFDALVTGGNSADGTSGLFFSGPNAVAANNGAPVGLFSPATYDSGSSGAHLDDDNPAFKDSLTLAAVDAGPATRMLNAVEQGIFKDLGYTVLSAETPAETLGEDFNRDGQNDLLIYNPEQTWSGIGFMDGDGNIAGSASLWTGWKPVGKGDFNRDGQTDIVIEHLDNDWHGILYMNGPDIQSSQGIPGWADWDIVGTGNFNNDGIDDILVRHQTQGWHGVWYMGGADGSQIQSSQGINVWSDWDVKGTGDFNGDGRAELVIQHQTQGWHGLLELDGNQRIVGSQSIVGWSDWDIVGTSDQNEDGQTDLLIQHKTQSWQGALLMKGNQVIASQSLNIWQGWQALG